MIPIFRITANVAVLLALLSLPLAACVAPNTYAPPTSNALTTRNDLLSRLYFGRAMVNGGQVSEQAWTTFLADVVTPRFPDGFTTWSALGQWRHASGTIVREPTFILEVTHPAETRATEAIKAIIVEYKHRFRQESVLWVRDRVDISF